MSLLDPALLLICSVLAALVCVLGLVVDSRFVNERRITRSIIRHHVVTCARLAEEVSLLTKLNAELEDGNRTLRDRIVALDGMVIALRVRLRGPQRLAM